MQLASGPSTVMWSLHVEPGMSASHSWAVAASTANLVRCQGAAAAALPAPHRPARDRDAGISRTGQLLLCGGHTNLYVHASLHASDQALSSSREVICQTALRFKCWTDVASAR